jgi:hypothetical protein
MKLNPKELASSFDSIGFTDEFNCALDMARANSKGEIWLIGSHLYKTLAKTIYSHTELNKPIKDFDFILENVNLHIKFPKEFELSRNRFGGLKLVKKSLAIDLIPLKKIYGIVSKNLPPTIENFLSNVPLNIQHLVYQLSDRKILGTNGIFSLEKKIIEVHNLEMAQHHAEMYKTTINETITKKAQDLGFTPKYL